MFMAADGKILVVDDDPDICEVLKDILELEGYSVETASSGYRALEIGNETAFDVVLMDVKMEGMNGVETFIEFKKIQPGVPVIMISAFAVEDSIREALRQGAFAIMSKPLDHQELLRKIEEARSGGNGGLILLADDNVELCNSLGDSLDAEGFTTISAHDGGTAVRMTREQKFDVIILDMKLPVMNGLETYLAIREIRPDAVAVVVSGYPEEMDDLAKRAVEKNAYIYLRKPLDIENFKDLLKEIVEQKRAGTLRKPEGQ